MAANPLVPVCSGESHETIADPGVLQFSQQTRFVNAIESRGSVRNVVADAPFILKGPQPATSLVQHPRFFLEGSMAVTERASWGPVGYKE